jgi:UDP-N-acetylmuramate--alanine ligase
LKRVHLIGIGGSGISAIARILIERGFQVSGSDRAASPLADALKESGVTLFTQHNASNVHGSDLVVRSSAIPDDHPEVIEARRLAIPVLKRSEFMDFLLQGYRCIAIAGTHGKTTTTAMVTKILVDQGRDPSYIIGGVSLDLSNNAGSGQGPDFIIEADEYDRMFHGLRPAIAVVTNIEYDHPDCFATPAEYYQAFLTFIQGMPGGGLVIGCQDDPGSARLLKDAAETGRRTCSYSISEARAVEHRGGRTHFIYQDQVFSLLLPGIHHVRNALAALKVAEELNIPAEQCAPSLENFHGTGRRFDVRGEGSGVVVIDDYAHHPTEIRATLDAARMRYPGQRIVTVWQPHTYSRTRQLLDDFSGAFYLADMLIVTEIFAAREKPPVDGFSGKEVAQHIAAVYPGQAFFAGNHEQAVDFLLANLKPGDILMVLSAGDADWISAAVLNLLVQTGQVEKE